MKLVNLAVAATALVLLAVVLLPLFIGGLPLFSSSSEEEITQSLKWENKTTYTLYRNSVLDSGMRIHVGTFDAAEKGTYNQENCFTVRDLFAGQPSVTVRFWCERGHFSE